MSNKRFTSALQEYFIVWSGFYTTLAFTALLLFPFPRKYQASLQNDYMVVLIAIDGLPDALTIIHHKTAFETSMSSQEFINVA